LNVWFRADRLLSVIYRRFEGINVNSVTGIVSFALVLVCLMSRTYLYSAQQSPSSPVAESEAHQERVKMDKDAEKIKDRWEEAAKAKREAEAKAGREAAEKAKAKLEEEIEKLDLPEDKTQRFIVKQVQVSGNSLVSTDEILADMPLVFNASDKPLYLAESKDLYDLRILYEVIQQPGQERQVSSRMIQGFTRYVLSVYQERHYAGIYVYVPADAVQKGLELKEGVLPIKILELRVTEVSINYYDPDRNKAEKGYLRNSAIYGWSPVQTGQVTNRKKLDDFINLLNLNPDRYVSASVTRGAEPNTLAVGYDVYEANPWHFFVQLDNGGTKDRKWTPRVGLINTNLLGFDDSLTAIYQAPWERGIEEQYSIYGSYDFPLFTPRARLNVYAGYTQFDITKDASGTGFIGNGSFVGAILRYNVFQRRGWFFDVIGSLSHEKSKVTPTLFPAMASNVSMELWGVGVNAHRSDDMSSTSFSVTRVESMGGSDRIEFTNARTNSDPHFTIYTSAAAHSRFLDPNKVGRLSGTVRWIASDERLAPAKMTTFGGMYSVRGYDEYEIVADGGVLASVQYEFDLVKYNQSQEVVKTESEQDKKPWVRKAAPLVFFDYGRAKNVEHVAGEKRVQTIYSVGVGALLELGDHFSGAVYYGYPLEGTGETEYGKGRVNVGLLYRW